MSPCSHLHCTIMCFTKWLTILACMTEPFEDFLPNHDTITSYRLICLPVECSKQEWLKQSTASPVLCCPCCLKCVAGSKDFTQHHNFLWTVTSNQIDEPTALIPSFTCDHVWRETSGLFAHFSKKVQCCTRWQTMTKLATSW